MRDLIAFDSNGASGAAFAAFTSSGTGLTGFQDIPWPAKLQPQPAASVTAKPDGSLPNADVLVVTWTMDEGHALSRVLTPGYDSDANWIPYTHNFASLSTQFRAGCPALELHRFGTFWMTDVGTKRVLCFKSDSHFSQDGPLLPNRTVWEQLIAETGATLVLTTGTGGGIGAQCEVGDVIVSSYVQFDCKKAFANEPFAREQFRSTSVSPSLFATASTLFAPNAGQLPADNTRPPQIVTSSAFASGVVTTDFFGFDNTTNTYGLQGEGDLSEMGDAVLGLVCRSLGSSAPAWQSVRNVSDPQISAAGMTIEQQSNAAASIYKRYGRWSSVCSAIVCWAVVAGS